MASLLSRLLSSFRTRSLDAASGTSRMDGAGRIVSLNTTILAGASVAAARAASSARNNPHVAAAISSLIANAVGTGIKPRSQHPDAKVRDAIHKLWSRWISQADAAGSVSFYGLQGIAVRAMVEGGESFARLCVRSPEDGLAVPFQVELIDRTQVPLEQAWAFAGPGALVRCGIEFNQSGRRAAYWVLPVNPNDPFAPLAPMAYTPTRVVAADMVHLYHPLVPNQLRGLTWLAPVLLRLHELDQYEDAALVRAKVAALLCGFIRDTDGAGAAGLQAGATPTNSAGTVEAGGMEPGSLVNLPPGADIAFSTPPDDKNYDPFVKSHLRAVAAGLGVTYEQISGDYAGVSYSSVRASLVEYRRRVEFIQHAVVVHQFCRPVWERFITLAVLSGTLDAPGFEIDPASYFAVEWLPPAYDWVDPLKDVQAEVMSINAGLTSRAQSVARLGSDVEEVDRQIAADRAREQRLNLAFTLPSKAAPVQVQENNANA